MASCMPGQQVQQIDVESMDTSDEEMKDSDDVEDTQQNTDDKKSHEDHFNFPVNNIICEWVFSAKYLIIIC